MTRRIRLTLAALYILLLHALVGLAVVSPERFNDLVARVGIDNSPKVLPHFTNMLRYHRWMDDHVPAGAVVFLGDSITQGLATAAVAPNSVNLGIGGQLIEQLADQVTTYQSLHRAGAIVLQIGVNNLPTEDLAYTEASLRELLARLPADTPLVWNAIMPADRTRGRRLVPADIVPVNAVIRALCRTRPNCVFVDTFALFTDAEGRMVAGDFLDGVHLSTQGYAKWIDRLRAALGEAMAFRPNTVHSHPN